MDQIGPCGELSAAAGSIAANLSGATPGVTTRVCETRDGCILPCPPVRGGHSVSVLGTRFLEDRP